MENIMHRMNAFMILAVAMLLGTASPALAQICTGFAMAPGATQATFGAEFPDGANTFGLTVARKAGDQALVGVGYAMTSFDDIGGVEPPKQHGFTALGSYEMALNAGSTGPVFAACPNAQATYSKVEDVSSFLVPLGLALQTAFEVADGVTFAPFVNPALFWNRMSFDGYSDSDTDFGWTVGGHMSIMSDFLVGAEFNKIGDGDGVFGIRFGLIF